MYRAVKMSGTWYGIKIDIEDDIENINEFVDGGEMVVLFDDIDQFKDEFDIDEVKIVEGD